MHNSKLSLLALVSVGALAIASCGKDRRGNNPIVKPRDAGPDAGDNPDGGNPPIDSGVDDAGNNNNPDTGVDGGVQMAECAVNTDCTSPADSCLNFVQGTGLVQCAGENTCQCFQACDPFVSVDLSGCPRPTEACGTAGAMSPTPGVCVPDMGGGTQGQACTSMFNGTHPFNNYAGDDCNGTQNYFCHGCDPLDVAGTCSRLCDTANGALCTSLDPTTQCVPFAPGEQQGICLTPITDLGAACTMDTECQGGLCFTALGAGQCSHECGVSGVCPQDVGICIFLEGMLSPSCVVECTVGAAGDTMCSGINPNLICENIGVAICIPRCMDNMDCPQAAPNCNLTTGHCGP